jgi:hypothetical protein
MEMTLGKMWLMLWYPVSQTVFEARKSKLRSHEYRAGFVFGPTAKKHRLNPRHEPLLGILCTFRGSAVRGLKTYTIKAKSFIKHLRCIAL